MPRYLTGTLTALILGMLVGGPYVYNRHRQQEYRNFRVVREGVLYRSGQLSHDGLQKVIHDHQIKTVVSLRFAEGPADPAPDSAEETWCREQGIHYLRVCAHQWAGPEGMALLAAGAIRIMKNEDHYPVLVHCFAGCHRTGAFVAVYRMEFENWTNAEAIAEIRQAGYSTLDDDWDVLEYLEQYRPRRLREISGDAEPLLPSRQDPVSLSLGGLLKKLGIQFSVLRSQFSVHH